MGLDTKSISEISERITNQENAKKAPENASRRLAWHRITIELFQGSQLAG